MKDELDWDIVGGESYPGTGSGWSVVKAASIDQTNAFDLDVIVRSEGHNDYGPYSAPSTLEDYSVSFVGVDFDEKGEPTASASSGYDEPLDEIDDLTEYVKSEYGLANKFKSGIRDLIFWDGVREVDLPAFDASLEVDGCFYGVNSVDSLSNDQAERYEVRASNAEETPIEIEDISNKEHRNIVENAVEEIENGESL